MLALALTSCAKKEAVPLTEIRAIAKEAYLYGFPMVDSYRIMHAYFVDGSNAEFKEDWNRIANVARVYTPEDKAVQSPNSDTPYSFLGADLRAEPLVLTVPAVDKNRYYSAQFIDLYTHNFAYVGSRATGNDAGVYLLAGPNWSGDPPPGVSGLIRCETDFAMVIYRTQLFGPNDLTNVEELQRDYRVQPLSRFLGTEPPALPPAIAFIKPLTVEEERQSLEFFTVLNFLLQFCPTHSSETGLMARFAKIGVGAGLEFDAAGLKPEIRKAIEDGRADAWQAHDSIVAEIAAGTLSSGDLVGTREYLKNNYLYRMVAAVEGIYGNSKEEAIYPIYFADADGQPLDGSTYRYELYFAPGQLPPVNAFWSVTMYGAKNKLLVDNPLDRYLINSAMLRNLDRDKDGSMTLYLQYPSPGPSKQSNWLPAPNGPFYVAMRLYWPKPEAFDGTWTKPVLKKAS
ncbi:MAG TPA: DUF1254 domain-containing protein [Candidatus Krumholzibacteria bacterium]|nr:DUF1254 domain-containing protein [Candidatus Krumholzibacteria bacterium]